MTTPDPGTDHTESEAHSWTVDIPAHPVRQDSPEYVAARTLMNQLAGQSAGLVYGPGPYQDHHGGSLWLKDATGWFMVRNLAGIEWSAQFCADPAKVDLLRQNARRLYAMIAPEVAQQLDPDGLLNAPITDAAGVARWTDSIFNAGVPLHPGFHTGVIPGAGSDGAAAADGSDGASPADGSAAAAGSTGAAPSGAAAAGGPADAPGTADPEPGGVHHYPTPIADIQLFKYDDFQLWVSDAEGNPAAVAPVSKRGSGDASVHVLYTTPGSQLAQQAAQAESANAPLILGPDHPISRQAFSRQQAAPASAGE